MNRTTARAALHIAARAVLFLCIACGDGPILQSPPSVTFQTDEARPNFGSVIVAPVDARRLESLANDRSAADDWQRVLAVYAGDSTGLPMLGTHVIAHDTLRFDPKFPPIRGTTYIARFDGKVLGALSGVSGSRATATATWKRELISGPATTSVEAVYPTTDSVPMNLLRMYVQFSAPMTVGDGAEKHVRLLDERDAVVENAFLVAAGGQELWDRDHTRLTIFFDPGRIKRDLTPHEALGLPLRAGHSYSLVIDSAMHDAQGRPLTRSYVKRFRVGPIDRVLPRVSAWRVTAPASGTLAPLTIDLPEPLDHALLGRMLVVKTGAGATVSGQASSSDHDRRWTFTPAGAWAASAYFIEVDTELEDLAGNNMKHLFDVMPGDSAARGATEATVRIPFTPRPAR